MKTIGTVRVTCSAGPKAEPPVTTMTSGASATISAALLRRPSESAPERAFDLQGAPYDPAQLLQSLCKCKHASPVFRIVQSQWCEHADAAHPLRLLRPRRHRPRRRRAAEKGDELAASCMTGKEHCEG